MMPRSESPTGQSPHTWMAHEGRERDRLRRRLDTPTEEGGRGYRGRRVAVTNALNNPYFNGVRFSRKSTHPGTSRSVQRT